MGWHPNLLFSMVERAKQSISQEAVAESKLCRIQRVSFMKGRLPPILLRSPFGPGPLKFGIFWGIVTGTHLAFPPFSP